MAGQILVDLTPLHLRPKRNVELEFFFSFPIYMKSINCINPNLGVPNFTIIGIINIPMYNGLPKYVHSKKSKLYDETGLHSLKFLH